MKLRKFFSRYGMLFKLTTTIFIAISVPILIAVWFLAGNAYSKVVQQNDELQLQSTRMFANFFRSMRDKSVETAVKIGYEKKVLSSYIELHPYCELEIIDVLRGYKRAVPTAYKCFVYFKNKDYLIGSSEKYTRDIFLDVYSTFNPEVRELLTETLNSNITTTCMISSFSSPGTQAPWLIIAVPVSIYKQYDAVVLFEFRQGSLGSNFLGEIDSNKYQFYILDEGGDLVFSNLSANSRTLSDEIFQGFIADRAAVSTTLQFDGAEYSVFKQYDSDFGLLFFTVISNDELLRPVETFYQVFRNTVILLVALCILIFTATIYINYRPISLITKKVRDYTDYDDATLGAGTDEMGALGYILDKRNSENEAMMEMIAEQQLVLTDYLLKGLLEGRPVSQSEINIARLPLKGPYFCVIVVARTVVDNAKQIIIAEKLYKSCGSDVCITQPIYESQQLILICTLAQDGCMARRQLAEELAHLLEEENNGFGQLGVGSVGTGLEHIRSSYINALIAVAAQSDSDKIVYYEDIMSTFNSFEHYPSEEVLRFLQNVRQGDEQSALTEFDSIIDNIAAHFSSRIIEQYVCYDVINMFIKAVVKMGISLSEEDIGKILCFSSVENLRESMHPAIKQVCAEVVERKANSGRRQFENIIRYIDENFANSELNLPMVADRFEMSIYKLSSIFNELAGMGFREYITGRRIEQSKRLLLETEKSVKEVAYEVGFRDVSYFVKLFKNICGMTPGKFKQ